MLIDEDRVSIRVHSDEAGWPRCALVRLLLQLHPLCLQLALQIADVGERGAAHAQIGAQISGVGDAAVFLLAAGTLLCQLMEVDLGRLVAGGDVDLVLGQNEVGKPLNLRLKLRDLRRSCRAADAVGHDFDGRCRIRRSGSG